MCLDKVKNNMLLGIFNAWFILVFAQIKVEICSLILVAFCVPLVAQRSYFQLCLHLIDRV